MVQAPALMSRVFGALWVLGCAFAVVGAKDGDSVRDPKVCAYRCMVPYRAISVCALLVAPCTESVHCSMQNCSCDQSEGFTKLSAHERYTGMTAG